MAEAHHDGSVPGVLALTDHRVLFRPRHGLVSYPLGDIADTRWSGGLTHGTLVLYAGGGIFQFKHMDKRDGAAFADRLARWRQWYGAQFAAGHGGAPTPAAGVLGSPRAGMPAAWAPGGEPAMAPAAVPPSAAVPPAPAPAPSVVGAPAVAPPVAAGAPVAPQSSAAVPAPVPSQQARPAGGSGRFFGRRRREAEAEAGQLLEELGEREAEAERLRAENTRLAAELEALAGADTARFVRETARIRRAHDEQADELARIGALLDAKVAAAAERAEREVRESRDSARRSTAEAEEAERRLATARSALVVTDDLALLQEAGLYEYRHPLADAVAYKGELDRLKDRYKTLTRNGRAVTGVTEWTVNGSAAEGRRMVRDFSKLMLRAYNAEADAAVRGMRPHRLDSHIDRLAKSRATIARLGKTMRIQVTDEYHRLRVRELELTADHLAKVDEERERRREERARQREEERLERDIARERARIDKERNRLVLALARARAVGQTDAAGIAELEGKLAGIDAEEEAINRREANTRAGYVYVISNIGAFGASMVKIGLTRRLDPMDRVHELGDASVPFRFDVHALIYSDDAVGLERSLHREFESSRVNRVNTRREFFHITPAQVRDALARHTGQHLLEFHEEPDAPEWRASGGARR
nr:DUF4041 domain-containing protein [Streptomyces sp. SID11385]